MKKEHLVILKNIEIVNSLPKYSELPEYLKNSFSRSLNYCVEKWKEEKTDFN